MRLNRFSILSLWKTLEVQSSRHQRSTCQSLTALQSTRTLVTRATSQASRKIHTSTAMAAEADVQWTGRNPLAELDPEINEIIGKEKNRQVMGLELIASEVQKMCPIKAAAV